MSRFIIAIAAQKGGVGKSSTCHALGSFLGRALLIDADAQGTLTTAVAGSFTHSLYDVLVHKKPIREAAVPALPAYGDKLHIIPATQQLASLDIATAADLNRQYMLVDALENHGDLAIIDCPAGQGVSVVAGLVAADLVVVPVATAPAAFEALDGFVQTIELVRKRLNPRLDFLFLPTLFAERQVLDCDVLEAMHDRYTERVLPPIPRRVSIAERMAAQHPSNHPAYAEVANIILERFRT